MPTKQKSGLYRSKVKIGVDAEGRPIVKWISGRTRAGLEDARREVIEHYISNAGTKPDELFGVYAVRWFRTRKEPLISASSRESYRTALNKDILPVFGERNLRAITPIDLQVFLNSYTGLSATKITMITATLKAIFAAACVDRILDHDPAIHLIKPAARPAPERRILSPDERARVEAACVSHPDGAYLAALYYLGCRPGEARGLQWGDIDWEAGTIHIQRDIDYKSGGAIGSVKTRSSDRVIPLPDPLREILWPLRGLPGAFLFAGKISGAPLSKSSAERLWLQLMHACGLAEPVPGVEDSPDLRRRLRPLVTPHCMRHNFATMCVEHGLDVYTTMRLLGHASITTTMNIYAHFTEQQLKAASAQVSEMFGKNKVAQKLHIASGPFSPEYNKKP